MYTSWILRIQSQFFPQHLGFAVESTFLPGGVRQGSTRSTRHDTGPPEAPAWRCQNHRFPGKTSVKRRKKETRKTFISSSEISQGKLFVKLEASYLFTKIRYKEEAIDTLCCHQIHASTTWLAGSNARRHATTSEQGRGIFPAFLWEEEEEEMMYVSVYNSS